MSIALTFSDAADAAVWFWSQPWSVSAIISATLFPLALIAMVSSKGLDFANIWIIAKYVLRPIGWVLLGLFFYVMMCSAFA